MLCQQEALHPHDSSMKVVLFISVLLMRKLRVNNSSMLQSLSVREPGCSPGQLGCKVWALSKRDLFFSPQRVKAITPNLLGEPPGPGLRAGRQRSLFDQYWLILLPWFFKKS